MKIKRALLSVWNKKGIVELGEFLTEHGVELLSTGGTQKALEEAGLKVTAIGDITGSGAVMDGRVKTLHPKIFGGILADRKNEDHLNDLAQLGGLEIDLVVVNFYPFVQEAVEKNLNHSDAIEFIDIGGPSMIRSAAKNYHSVTALSDPGLYADFMDTFTVNENDIPLDFRKKAAARVFQLTTAYEAAIAHFLSEEEDPLPDNIILPLTKSTELRYGENPHQKAAFYLTDRKSPEWVQHQGKTLSYNNYADMESAWNIPQGFDENACVIIKHANPCGFGLGEHPLEAYERAVSTDPVSYFGGIVGFNCKVDETVADALVQPFLECVIAPGFTQAALKIFEKKKNLRIVETPQTRMGHEISIKSVAGGYLCQEKDRQQDELEYLDTVTKKLPTVIEKKAIALGWKLVRHVKSNAIVFAGKNQLLGVGAGQMSRIDSVKIAIRKVKEAGLDLQGAIMASDAFFPFPDSIELAAKAGISAVIQPGGSIKDESVIQKADELQISMVFTGTRHFLH